MLDLDAYLRRVGYQGGLKPTCGVLQALHLAHATHIPFENLDVLLGRPIRLDLPSLQGKLVTDRRGGYCFEQNLLFSAVLRELGFSLTQLAARVRFRAAGLLPRTHMVLLVEADGERYLADVGFGGEGLLLPVAFDTSEPTRQYAWSYRIVEEPGQWALQTLQRDDSWKDMYCFTLEPQHQVDYELASYYVSTHPDSIFVRTLTAQRVTPEARYMLRNRELTVDRSGAVSAQAVSDEELLQVLESTFGLSFPPGTVFAVPVR